MFQIGIITIFPQMFDVLNYGIIGRAIQQELVQIHCWNPRRWASDIHGSIDDKPYGGGPGMVMMYEPLAKAITHAKNAMLPSAKTIYLSPQGRKIIQSDLNDVTNNCSSLLFIAGRYEGIDERLISAYVDEEWSLGDFVLSGGEIAAIAFIDAIVRLLPGSLGGACSAVQDSFMNGLLDYPHYTRPMSVAGGIVPPVLVSGHHLDIARWRRKQSLGRTWLRRPDLLADIELSELDKQLLHQFQSEYLHSVF